MDSFFALLKKSFALFDKVENRWTVRWQKHANRRSIYSLLAIALLCSVTYLVAIRAPNDFPTDTLITVTEGESVDQIGSSLFDQNVIRSPLDRKNTRLNSSHG